jgi:hypothetical protein
VYIGAYNKGIRDSQTPNSELTFPNSSLATNLLANDLIAMKEVPFRISTTGPNKNSQVVDAKANTKLPITFELVEMTPSRASWICSKREKTPTENVVPGI